jgi:RND family efflux transporter MFP subunit
MAVKSHSITNAPRRWPLLAPWILIIAVLLILPLAGCGDAGSDGANAKADADSTGGGSGEEADAAAKSEDETAEEAKPERKRKERTTSVRVSEAFRGDLVIPVIAEGTIRARHDAELRTELAGRIVRIAVTEGQTMRKGQLIAKLDDREYEVASEEARATYLEAVSLLAIEEVAIEIPERPQDLQAKIDELGDLEAQGVITREERLAREVSLDVNAIKEGHYRLDVLASRSGIAAARAQLEHVTVNQVICTLVNNTDIEAEVGVLESDIGKLDIGRPALLAIPALNDTVRVKVDVISPQFDSSTRTCRVLLRLQNESGQMRPGMFVRAIISGESFSDRLLVPKEAILTRDGRPLLFKVDGDRAKWLYLKIGQRNDNLVEITGVLQGGSLEPGDRVVVADHLTLAHDAKIKVKKVLPIRDPWGTTE